MTPKEDDVTLAHTAPARTAPAPAAAAAPLRVLTDRELDRDIPYGIRIAASWSWRLGLILLMAGTLVWLLSHITLLIIPIMVAALLAGHRYLEVTYEDFISKYSETARRILAFLNVEEIDVRFPDMQKVIPDPVEQVVENLDELSSVLRGTPYEVFLR